MFKFFHPLTILSIFSELSVYGNIERTFLMLTNLCFVQCKQAVGSTVNCLSHCCHRGFTSPKGGANGQDLACPVCHREINVLLGWPEGQSLLWDDSLLLTSFVTCALPSLRPGHAILLERFVMAALYPVSDIWYYPFGHWFDPSSERENTELLSGSSWADGWPWGANPEELVSEGTTSCSIRMWGAG